MRKMTLKENQDCCLDILKVFDAFCRDHGLRYYLLGGTALGAVRHHGFIPWDDDIDVGLMRADYERFCAAFPDEGIYRLTTIQRQEGYYTPYAKLCNTNTHYEEFLTRNAQNGVFIDIFPLDYISGSDKDIRSALFKKRLYNHAFLVDFDAQQYLDESWPKRVTRRLLSKPYARLNAAEAVHKVESALVSQQPTDRIMNLWGAWNEREISDAAWFGGGALMPFEDLNCLVPAEWDKYLTKMYGADYMTPKKMHYHGAGYFYD